MSVIEAVSNVIVGYLVAAALTWAVLPAFGYYVQISDALGISAIFTLASIARSYVVRRVFARIEK